MGFCGCVHHWDRAMTTRRWAWKRPSFEESVIAHWSTYYPNKNISTSQKNFVVGLENSYMKLVGISDEDEDDCIIYGIWELFCCCCCCCWYWWCWWGEGSWICCWCWFTSTSWFLLEPIFKPVGSTRWRCLLLLSLSKTALENPINGETPLVHFFQRWWSWSWSFLDLPHQHIGTNIFMCCYLSRD